MQQGITLQELSELTGLPVSSVSRIENGKTALTFDNLCNISEALGVDVMQVIRGRSSGIRGHEAPDPAEHMPMRRSVGRAGEGEVVETPRGNYLYLVAALLQKQFIPIIGDVTALDISTYGEYAQHSGEEFVYVLSGTLELHTEMYTPAVLEQGDYVYFDSGMRHAYIARGETPCRVLSICSTPDPQLAVNRRPAGAANVLPIGLRPKT